MEKTKSCKDRWAEHKNNRVQDLKKLYSTYCDDYDNSDIYEYGLAFDYVAPLTFGDKQKEGYWRYQISCGGPQEEFRFYSSGYNCQPHRITFVFLDWFDGHERKLQGNDLATLNSIWQLFQELGSTKTEYSTSMQDMQEGQE